MKWFLAACVVGLVLCDEVIRTQITPEAGEKACVEAICKDIEDTLNRENIAPTEFKCEWKGK